MSHLISANGRAWPKGRGILILLLGGLLNTALTAGPDPSGSGSFVNLLRQPDSVVLTAETGTQDLTPGQDGLWRSGDTQVRARRAGTGLQIELEAPAAAVQSLRLQWRAQVDPSWLLLGDAWERAYGDLRWAAPDPKRVMPWYFLVADGGLTHGYGVMTGPAALCHWQTGPEGITLTADVRCGGRGVLLGARTLKVCTVLCRRGEPGETSFQAARAFCKSMCPHPRLPKEPVYGFNDWYYAYGQNDAREILKDAAFTSALAPRGGPKPFMVVDDGWQGKPEDGPRPWLHGNAKFPSMPALAEGIRATGCRPGVWYRPLEAAKNDPAAWRLGRDPQLLDPSVPAVRALVAREVAQLRSWGFDLIKHDYSTFDLSGRWGSAMAPEFTRGGWAFADRSVTTAEVILELYRCIREATGDGIVLGCNTMSHLAAGLFEVNRIGDDTSGQEWNRTRTMGVNALAFRGAQNGTFYLADPDCVGLAQADAIPWAKNQQWLQLAAASGMPLFISMRRSCLGPDQTAALKEALALASRPLTTAMPGAEPLDWKETLLPKSWKLQDRRAAFTW